MGLADQFAALRPNHGGIQCRVGNALDRMDADDQAALLAALANPSIQGAGISLVLRNNGYDVGDQAVSRHRRGVCSCP